MEKPLDPGGLAADQLGQLRKSLSRAGTRPNVPNQGDPEHGPQSFNLSIKTTNWRAVICFFFLGVLIGLPLMVVTTGSKVMFDGYTGVYGVCQAVTGAATSIVAPFLAPYISYDVGTGICITASILTYVLCTLPNPLEGAQSPDNEAGPVVGVMLGGFVYAYGTNLYMAAAAFFPQEAVLGLSTGAGCSVILGPSLYTGFMAGFHDDWRRSLLVFLPTVIGFPIVWWIVADRSCREAAEASRRATSAKLKGQESSSSGSETGETTPSVGDLEGGESPDSSATVPASGGFSQHHTRTSLLIRTILPRYVVPLVLCTTSAMITLLGTTPTLQTLARLRNAPEGNLQFQLAFLSYGTAQFLFSILASLRPIPLVWIWTGVQVTVMTIGVLQLAYPFLTYYGVWVVVLFLTGACVGGGVTNTNYKIAEDFRRAGEHDEVRSFAMSYAGLGNFSGDALGGGLAILVEVLASRNLASGH